MDLSKFNPKIFFCIWFLKHLDGSMVMDVLLNTKRLWRQYRGIIVLLFEWVIAEKSPNKMFFSICFNFFCPKSQMSIFHLFLSKLGRFFFPCSALVISDNIFPHIFLGTFWDGKWPLSFPMLCLWKLWSFSRNGSTLKSFPRTGGGCVKSSCDLWSPRKRFGIFIHSFNHHFMWKMR